MKANDSIPQDEMLLAEAIAAAKARGWVGTTNAMFRNRFWRTTTRPSHTTRACCALGAIRAAGVDLRAIPAGDVALGNDFSGNWSERGDLATFAIDGESLGWAFRCAMTQEEP